MGVFSSIDLAFQAADAAGSTMATALVSTGENVLLVLTGIILSWHFMTMILDSHPHQSLAKILHSVLTGGVVAALLLNWGNVSTLLIDGVASLTDAAGQTGGVQGTLGGIADAIGKLTSQKWVPSGLGDFLLHGDEVIAGLGNFAVAMLAAAALGVAAASMAILLNIGKLLLYVCLFLGPVLLPWTMIKRGEFLADGWIRTAITAALYKVVGVAVALIGKSFIDAMVNAATQAATTSYNGEPVSALPILIGALFWSVVVLMLIWQIPTIASSLAGGQPISSNLPQVSMPDININKSGGGSKT